MGEISLSSTTGRLALDKTSVPTPTGYSPNVINKRFPIAWPLCAFGSAVLICSCTDRVNKTWIDPVAFTTGKWQFCFSLWTKPEAEKTVGWALADIDSLMNCHEGCLSSLILNRVLFIYGIIVRISSPVYTSHPSIPIYCKIEQRQITELLIYRLYKIMENATSGLGKKGAGFQRQIAPSIIGNHVTEDWVTMVIDCDGWEMASGSVARRWAVN